MKWEMCALGGGGGEVINTSDKAGTHSMETHWVFMETARFSHL